jgi:hypothetical protein
VIGIGLEDARGAGWLQVRDQQFDGNSALVADRADAQFSPVKVESAVTTRPGIVRVVGA